MEIFPMKRPHAWRLGQLAATLELMTHTQEDPLHVLNNQQVVMDAIRCIKY
jgi:hypothetical protein